MIWKCPECGALVSDEDPHHPQYPGNCEKCSSDSEEERIQRFREWCIWDDERLKQK